MFYFASLNMNHEGRKKIRHVIFWPRGENASLCNSNLVWFLFCKLRTQYQKNEALYHIATGVYITMWIQMLRSQFSTYPICQVLLLQVYPACQVQIYYYIFWDNLFWGREQMVYQQTQARVHLTAQLRTFS